mgnify:CR=1 FL=1|tara:strand:+ start:16957 stop:18243 length:1287 start_codon:yes stop_codon:yes gene_type:complete
MKTAIFTICSRNYLAYALTLGKSVKAAEPGTPFFIYLADDLPEAVNTQDATIVPVRDLALEDLLDMAFRYTVMEFNTAIKADCFLDLLTRRGFDAAIYLDPDIQVYAPLTEVHAALEAGVSAVLTPHVLGPLPKGTYPDEREVLKSGTFNLGFGAFAGTAESLEFILWWRRKLHVECYSAPEKNLFVDQRFVDFAPCFIEQISILRHPGYNVAYWNLARRRLEQADGGVQVNGARLVFFHFSGVRPGQPEVFSKHLGGRGGDPGDLALSLVADYLGELDAAGHAQWATATYAYGRFRDGSPILPPMRRQPPSAGSPDDWFGAPDYDWWNAPDPTIDQGKGMVITRLMSGFYSMRPDLQVAYPLTLAAGRRGFHSWFCRHGAREYQIPDKFLDSGTIGTVGLLHRYLEPSLRRIRARMGGGNHDRKRGA